MILNSNKKILLLLMPFWPPLIPPMGLSCLKSYLQQRGYSVKAVDVNVDEGFRCIYDDYFTVLDETIPSENRGNFYNIGIDVMQNHMTAHMQHNNSGTKTGCHLELLDQIIRENFFCTLDKVGLKRLDQLVTRFFRELDHYLARLLEIESPGVLGISVYKGTFAASLFAFQRAKEIAPAILTVMGGGIFADQLAVSSPNFDFFLEQTPYIDKLIVGEGEQLFHRLLEGQLPASQRVFTIKDMDGKLLNLSTAPLPDFSDFDITRYSQMAAYTSRSCPFQCGFCAETVNWGTFRKKSASQVAAELLRLYNAYGYQLFLMSDSLLNPIVSDLADQLFNSGTAIYWDGYLRADSHVCDDERVFSWRRGGFYRARLGIESGSPRILELMGKKITPGQIKTAIAALAHSGIKTSTYWVIGYPGETEADFLDTLRIIEEMKDDLYEVECNPFRFYPSGQVQSQNWMETGRSVPLFPESARKSLILQTWIMEDPEAAVSREVIYQRVNRFVAHCSGLGIPNPYSWPDIHTADERWKKLHPNAVPPLMAFKETRTVIDECNHLQRVIRARDIIPQDDDDFDF